MAAPQAAPAAAVRPSVATHQPAPAASLLHRWLASLVLLALLAIACEPLFFSIDRLMVFDTVPRDDYARFLLWLAGAPGGVFPVSPYGYRILSMAAAWPLYHLLPNLPLTNLPATLTPFYVRATGALAALSYLSQLAAGVVAYRLGRDRFAMTRRDSLLAGALLWALVFYTQFFSIDAFAVLLVTICLYLLPRPFWFAVMLLLATFANEKVAIVFALWLTLRCVLHPVDRHRFARQWGAAIGAIAVYAAALLVLHLPGNSYQLQPGGYLATVAANLRASVSARGLLLNALPVVVLAAVGGLGWRGTGRGCFAGVLRATDLWMIPALVVVALVLTQFFQTGRIVMHAAPLLVLPAAAALGRWLDAAGDTSNG